jgi:hypothetical protein
VASSAIDLGSDYADQIRSSLSGCSAVLVLIGKGWIDVRDDDGLLVTGNAASREFLARSVARTTREDSLIEIAEQTGGLAVFSTNDLTGGLARIVDDLSGYYLIGYVPDQATFASRPGPPRFHEVKVEVKRDGVKVRSRKGFYGVTDEFVAQASPPSSPRPGDHLKRPFRCSTGIR